MDKKKQVSTALYFISSSRESNFLFSPSEWLYGRHLVIQPLRRPYVLGEPKLWVPYNPLCDNHPHHYTQAPMTLREFPTVNLDPLNSGDVRTFSQVLSIRRSRNDKTPNTSGGSCSTTSAYPAHELSLSHLHLRNPSCARRPSRALSVKAAVRFSL